MANWRDEIKNAGVVEFRGAEFYLSTSSKTVGRRTVIHSFPGRDDIEVEDLGRLPRRFSISGFVLGDDAQAQRDVVQAAFEQAGPGKLIHPYYGEMQAVAGGQFSTSENLKEGRIAHFSVQMIRVDDQVPTVPQVDTIAKVDEAADNMQQIAAAVYAAEHDVDGLIQAYRDSAVQTIQNAAAALESANNAISGRLSVISETGQAIIDFSSSVGDLIGTPADIASSLTSLSQSVLGAAGIVNAAIGELLNAGETPTTAELASAQALDAEKDRRRADVMLETMRSMLEFGDDETPTAETTPQKAIEKANQEASIRLSHANSVAETCRTASLVPIESRTQAIAIRDELREALDDLLETSEDDNEYNAIFGLSVAISKHLTTVSASLPEIIEYTPPSSLPAVVVAYSLYADADRDLEIAARNSVRNPCFVPGGEALEVLSD